MADPSTADASAPNLNLSAEEKRVYGQLFRQADSENIGVVTGEAAVKFFERTRLDARVLGEIWQIADTENRGLLTPAGFGVVLRLIGHYQAGREPSPELAFQPGPIPKFEGGAPGGAIQPPPGPPPSSIAAPIQPQTSGSSPIRVPPLTPDKVQQYAGLFEKSGAQGGNLPGEQAKQIFERAGLPNEVLGRIWNLADTEQRGSLVMTEFIIAMHLLASYKSGAMRALPNVLPAGLYDAAARRGPPRQLSGSVPAPVSAIPRQFSGAGGRVASPLGRSSFVAPPQAAQLTGQSTGQGGDWAISPADKQRFDQIYSTLDRSNKGFITGEEAVPFFSNSKLPEEALAQIWDLADINSQGRLTREEFAVAMYLIRQQRGKDSGRGNLPATLPANLIPPNMRNQARPPTQPTAPAFEQPAAPMPKSAADDLFGLDALSSSPPPPAQSQVPLSTGGSAGYGDPFGNSKSPASMTPTSPTQSPPQLQQSTFKPFVPSSTFGRSLDYQPTGASTSSSSTPQRGLQPQTTGMDDLLGDGDPEESKKLTSDTAELANLSNQVGTLSRQMQDVQGQRANSQNELTQASTQKREFEGRLAQLRSLYEKEVKDVNGLKERLAMAKSETQKLKQEMAMIEGTHADLQTQKAQITAALQADQQENASLKERMRVINAEIAQMKPQLEKLRLEARQQKGLVAINKKQLATNEGERDKVKTEAEELTKSNEENAKAIAASSQVQSPPAAASPAPSTMSANNPFFRRQGSTGDAVFSPFSPSAQSPAAPAHETDRSFDDVFGTSFGSAGGAAAKASMPPTSFKSEAAASHDIPSPAMATALPTVTSLENSRVSSPIQPIPMAGSRDISGATEPPAPPESRQISSSFLPFPHGATDSLSSSRQVSAPNSRFGEDGSTGAETPTNYSGATPTGSSAGGQIEASAPAPATESQNASDSVSSIPGAFPGDSNSHIVATPTGGSTQSERAIATNNTGPIDPFGFDKETSKAPPGATKDDFDSAFAGFGGPSKGVERRASPANTAGSSKVNQEFPPLQQLDDDESSDSDDGGFDDDFTAGSGGHSRQQSAAIAPPAVAAAVAPTDGLQPPRPAGPSHNTSAISTGMDPPTPNAQSSPPTYETAATTEDKTQAEADSYAGLLPSREDPTSNSPTQPFGTSSVLGAPESLSKAPVEAPKPTPPAKVPFDDFDNEFDDLEDAKEGGDDDDFANISANDRSMHDSFDPTFDSPIAGSKASIHTAQGSTSGFDAPSNGFGDFTSSPVRTTAVPAAATSSPTKAVNDNHDWDAIFAGLDGPSATSTSNAAEETPAAASASTTANGTSKLAPARPEFGRALTEAGVHDDPILKELTEMGYARKDALSALEKYDYNLERAANYLASQS